MVHNFKKQRSKHVEPLTVANFFIPSGVRQEDSF